MRILAYLFLIFGLLDPASAQDRESPAAEGDPVEPNPVMVMKTSLGEIEIELFPKAAPKTVRNFVDLAEGNKEFKDPKSGEMVKRPFYDGLIFHRIIRNFMIQGGCPLGTGSGNPGYKFEDEINAKGLGLGDAKVIENGRPTRTAMMALAIRDQAGFQRQVLQPLYRKMGIRGQEQLTQHKEELQKALEALTVQHALENLGYVYDDSLEVQKPLKGYLAMANSGPNSNGSQFFINLVDTPHLIGKHTVFGKVVKGMDVVEKLGETKVSQPGAKPLTPVKIVSIRLKKKPAADAG